jgi:DNA-binding FadR family transcriptional regulator
MSPNRATKITGREQSPIEVVPAPGKNAPQRQLAQPRVGEIVANVLRSRIIFGQLADGDLLPKLDDLIKEFMVSRPSLREAMRILETEGLISVRRGKVGGAVIHRPNPETAAYMLGLVMQSRQYDLTDLAAAICVIEPVCARLVAERTDHIQTVVPLLEKLNDEAANHLDDGPTFTRLARRFHNQLAGLCPVQTLVLLVGVLESLWSAHEETWADRTEAGGNYPSRSYREEALLAHRGITEAIRAGTPERVEYLVRQHLQATQAYSLTSEDWPLLIVNIRSHFKEGMYYRSAI